MKISEMQLGATVKTELMVSASNIRKTSGNPPRDYLAITLTDGTETLDGKMWNYSDPAYPITNDVVRLTGTIGEYQGKKQITLSSIAKTEEQDKSAFSIRYTDDLDALWSEVLKRIDNISDSKLRDIVRYIYDTYKPQILQATSAKVVHHLGAGGNLAHSIEVHDHAVNIAIYLQLRQNREVSVALVKAGALLHDIGKPFTYSVDGAVINYTLNGQLFEHIINGLNVLQQAAQHFDGTYNKSITLLSHIIAAHHGQLEYGSPVTPRFAEAYIVNMADNISANLEVLYAANAKAEKEGKEVTDRLFTLGNREHILQRTVAELLRTM